MARKQPPAIADLIRSGQLDASGALDAVTDQLSQMTAGMGGMDDEPLDSYGQGQTQEAAEAEAEAKKTRIQAIGHRLLSLANEQVKLRQDTEERWYADVRQFNGQYDPGMFQGDETNDAPYGSRVFVPLTRRLVNLCEARLFDIIFQPGERNFVLKPSPVPEMAEGEKLAGKLPPEQQVMGPGGIPIAAGAMQQAIKDVMEQAERKCDAMQREVDDQLAECRYPVHGRNAIHDAVLMGTGVLKGPFVLYKANKRWDVNEETGASKLSIVRRPVPVTVRVDPWNFFPDMSSTTIDEAEFVYERHYLTKKELAALKNMQDVDLDALRTILEVEPGRVSSDNHRERLRALNGANGASDKRYEVWEYHGPLSIEDLEDCGCDMADADPLEQYTGIVWFCDGVVLKAAVNPLDSGNLPYRVFTWQKDESNIFGFGLPYEVRDSQTSANSAFRAMLDNMGLCALPQVFIDDTKAEPINGRNILEPGKFWRNKSGRPAQEALQFIDIESRLPELQAIFGAAKALIEEVGTLPAFLQGQEAPAAMQSATQASIAWTAANLWVRRCVRNWDDDVVTPQISDYVDWNMQYSPKKCIKGDAQVQALGISSLVELEGQAQKVQMFVQAANQMGVPISNQLQMLRAYARSLKLDPDLMLPDDEEIAAIKDQEKKTPKVDIEQEKLAVAKSNNEMDAQTAKDQVAMKGQELAQRERDNQTRQQIAVAQIASQERISMEDARNKYGFEGQKTAAEIADRREQRRHEAQMFNAEAELKVSQGSGI